MLGPYYLLVDKKVYPCDFAAWISNNAVEDIAKTNIGDILISTVFLSVACDDPPELFETQVFGGLLDGMRECCCSFKKAQIQHECIVNLCKGL